MKYVCLMIWKYLPHGFIEHLLYQRPQFGNLASGRNSEPTKPSSQLQQSGFRYLSLPEYKGYFPKIHLKSIQLPCLMALPILKHVAASARCQFWG